MTDNYLFLGGAGFIGSSIIRQLPQDMGSPNITVLEPTHADISRLKGCNVRLARGTLQDIELIERLVRDNRITTVVHLVSNMVPGSSYEDYLAELYNVVRPTIRIMELCSRLGLRFVYFSSGGAIYGERKEARPFRESDPLKPISYYGLAKQLVETNICFEHRANGLQYLILRPSNPYGPAQHTNGQQGLISVALGNINARQPVTVWGDGSAVRDYIYIDDMAQAACAIMHSCTINEAINIGSGEGLTVKDVLGYVNDVIAAPVRIQYGNARRGDVSCVVLDTTRMRQIYTLPLTEMRIGIRRTIEKAIK